MVRKSSFVIGLGLAVLWWLGLSIDQSARVLWFDAVAAVLSFGIGGLVNEPAEGEPAVGGAIACAVMSVGLGALWIIGMSTRQPAWANWFNFLFAVAYMATAVLAVSGRRVHLPATARRRV
jgi:hypothetical protein